MHDYKASGRKWIKVTLMMGIRVCVVYGRTFDSCSVVAEEWCFIANTSIPEQTFGPTVSVRSRCSFFLEHSAAPVLRGGHGFVDVKRDVCTM